jgi:Holliday junction resolvase RusA-like endonuclease
VPVTQGSKDYIGNGVMREVGNRNGALDIWRDAVRRAVEQATWGRPIVQDDECAVIGMCFFVHLASAWQPDRFDWDKLARAVNDGVTASGVWRDDAQSYAGVVERYPVPRGCVPGVRIVIDARPNEEVIRAADQMYTEQGPAGRLDTGAPSYWTQQGR